MFIFCCSLIFRWCIFPPLPVEARQGEKPYAYEVKDHKLQLLPVPRTPITPFFSVRPAQTKPVRNMAPLASHITVSPYQDIPPPHMTPVTPVPPKNPAHHSTQTGGRPLPCWLPVSLLAAYSFPGSQRHGCLSAASTSNRSQESPCLASPPLAGGCLSSLAAPPPLHLLPTSWYHGGGCKPDSGLARRGAAPTSAAAKRRLPLRLEHN